MRSPSTRRVKAALLSGVAAFVFFILIWNFAAKFSLGLSLGLALFMGVIAAMGSLNLARFRDDRASH